MATRVFVTWTTTVLRATTKSHSCIVVALDVLFMLFTFSLINIVESVSQ